jgi:hypothetical protein
MPRGAIAPTEHIWSPNFNRITYRPAIEEHLRRTMHPTKV